MKHNEVTFVYLTDAKEFQCRCFLDDLDTTISFTLAVEQMSETLRRLPHEAVELLLGPQLTALVKGRVS